MLRVAVPRGPGRAEVLARTLRLRPGTGSTPGSQACLSAGEMPYFKENMNIRCIALRVEYTPDLERI